MRDYLKEFTLLYAEDDSYVRAKMNEYFKVFFKRIYIASDGQEALELQKRYLPDIAILDVDMPKVDGLEVARKIREIDTRIRIIMLTAHVDTELLLRAAEIDMSKYLVKPVFDGAFQEAFKKVALELSTISKKHIKLAKRIIYFIEKDAVFCDDKEVNLSLKEKKLLNLLISNRKTYTTFESIMAYLWDENFNDDISKDSVKAQISNLRKKLPGLIIENIYAKGYCLR